MKPTGQYPKKRDNETLAEAIRRYEDEKAELDPLFVNQGKLEVWTQEEIDAGRKQAEEWMELIKFY